MKTAQPAILATIPPVGRYVFFALTTGATPDALRESLARLTPLVDGEQVLLAIGPQLVATLGAQVPGLREFPAMHGHGVDTGKLIRVPQLKEQVGKPGFAAPKKP